MCFRMSKVVARFILVAGFVIGSTIFAAPSAQAATGPTIGLFQDANYGGCAYYIYASRPAISNFSGLYYNTSGSEHGKLCTKTPLNDSVSSVSNGVPRGCYLNLSTDANYHGNGENLDYRVFAPHVKYNDQYSSLLTIC